jgi:hypothetical protein
LTSQTHIFVLDIVGRPTLAFEAASLDEAREICGDADLRTDLCAPTSAGLPICSDSATLALRPANTERVAAQNERPCNPASEEFRVALLQRPVGV